MITSLSLCSGPKLTAMVFENNVKKKVVWVMHISPSVQACPREVRTSINETTASLIHLTSRTIVTLYFLHKRERCVPCKHRWPKTPRIVRVDNSGYCLSHNYDWRPAHDENDGEQWVHGLVWCDLMVVWKLSWMVIVFTGEGKTLKRVEKKKEFDQSKVILVN